MQLLFLIALCTLVNCQVTRTPWKYMRTPAGAFPACPAGVSQHGQIAEYNAASIPAENANWLPCGPQDSWCKNSDTLGIQSASRLPNCFQLLDFGYFQTYITIPTGTQITTATIDFALMDDGARITIFNSAHPSGVIDQNSYVYLGQTSSSSFAQYLVPGVNRLVITQVDDCASANNIIATVSLDGETVPVITPAEPQCFKQTCIDKQVIYDEGYATASSAGPDYSQWGNLSTGFRLYLASSTETTPKVINAIRRNVAGSPTVYTDADTNPHGCLGYNGYNTYSDNDIGFFDPTRAHDYVLEWETPVCDISLRVYDAGDLLSAGEANQVPAEATQITSIRIFDQNDVIIGENSFVAHPVGPSYDACGGTLGIRFLSFPDVLCRIKRVRFSHLVRVNSNSNFVEKPGDPNFALSNICWREPEVAKIVVPPNQTLSCPACAEPIPPANISGPFAVSSIYYSDVVTEVCGGAKKIERTWQAVDVNGYTITGSPQTINIVDDANPTFTYFPPNVTVCNDGHTPAITGTPLAEDTCSSVNITFSDNIVTSGSVKTITRTWKATDACQNSVSKTQTIISASIVKKICNSGCTHSGCFVLIGEGTYDQSIANCRALGMELADVNLLPDLLLLQEFGTLNLNKIWVKSTTLNLLLGFCPYTLIATNLLALPGSCSQQNYALCKGQYDPCL